jgi:O-antigen/teichoic acid export membrane protein
MTSAPGRDRRIWLNAMAGLGTRAASAALGFYVFPLYFTFFQDRAVLGAWLTLVSLLNWVLAMDLGLGNGLRNELAKALAGDDLGRANALVASTYVATAAACGLLAMAVLGGVPALEAWLASPALRGAVLAVVLGTLLQFCLQLVNAALYALELNAVIQVGVLAGNAGLGLYLTMAAVLGRPGRYLEFALAYVLAMNLPLAATTAAVFATRLGRGLRLRLDLFDRGLARTTLALGGKFFLLQAIALFVFNANTFMVMEFAGAAAVVRYQTYHKLFHLVTTVFMLATAPTWSAITHAQARGDYGWIRRTRRRLVWLWAGASAAEAVLAALARPLILAWVRDPAVLAPAGYAAILALNGVMTMGVSACSYVTNGLGEFKVQAVALGGAALALVPLAWLLVRTPLGASGVPLANALVLVPYAVAGHRHITRYLDRQDVAPAGPAA